MSSGERSAALIVVNFNGARFVGGCLDSLKAQTVPASEIIVVDNGSTDESVRIVAERHSDVTLIQNHVNLGLGGGVNRGLKAAAHRFPFVGILNTDITADPAWLAWSLETVGSDERIAACASLCLDWSGSTVDSAGGSAINVLLGIWGCPTVGMRPADLVNSHGNRPFPVSYPLATAFVARSSAFERVGPFDDSFGLYFEDVDWGWRCRLAGLSVVCDPRAVVRHYGYGSSKSGLLKLNIARRAETNLLATYHKNLSTQSQIVLLPMLIVLRAVMALSYLPISARLTAAKLSGLAAYGKRAFSRRLRRARHRSQSNRQCSDLELFVTDPRNAISVRSVAKLAPAWMRVMRSIFGR